MSAINEHSAASGTSGRAAGLAYLALGPWGATPTDEAPPLLLLPGLLDDRITLQRLARALARGPVLPGSAARPARPAQEGLKGRRLLLVEPLGAGQSEVPEDLATYAWPAQVARLRALLAALGLPLVDAVGLSLGGMWLQHALAAGLGVRRVVLCATAAEVDPRLACVIDSLQGQHDAGLPAELLCRSLLPFLFSPAFLARPGAVPTLLALMPERLQRGVGLRGQLRALRSHDLGDRLRAAAAGRSVALIQGEQDFLIPAPAQARLQQAVFGAGGATRRLAGAGHCLWFEEPAAFAAAILESLEGG